LSADYPLPGGSRVGVLLSGGNVNVSACGFLTRTGRSGAGASKEQTSTAKGPNLSAKRRQPAKILLCAPIEPDALAALQLAGNVDFMPNINEQSLLSRIGDYHALIVGARQRVSADLIKYGYNLRVIGS